MTLVVYLDFNMRVVFLLIALTFGAMADTTCIDYGNGMKICTNSDGDTETIWTY